MPLLLELGFGVGKSCVVDYITGTHKACIYINDPSEAIWNVCLIVTFTHNCLIGGLLV